MDKQDIKYKIELGQYEFELKYGKDFKGLIIWIAGIVILLFEGLISGKFASYVIRQVVSITGGVMLLLMILTSIYLFKRKSFLKKISELKNVYEKYCEND